MTAAAPLILPGRSDRAQRGSLASAETLAAIATGNVPSAELDTAVKTLTDTILAMSPMVLRIGKRALYETQRLEEAEASTDELRLVWGVGGQVLPRDPLDPAARRTEAQHVAVVEHPAGDRPPVNPGPVA